MRATSERGNGETGAIRSCQLPLPAVNAPQGRTLPASDPDISDVHACALPVPANQTGFDDPFLYV
jgi:hypothetical protein